MGHPLPALGCLALFGLGSCSGGDPASGLFAPGETRDLIVVSIDTLRADRLPFYGAVRATAGDPAEPWSLAWLAAHGTLWENAWAPAGMTLPSFSTLWTGLAPPEHGAMDNHTAIAAPTFAMDLARRGWQGHSVVSNFVLRKGSGLQRGFRTTAVHARAKEAGGPADLLRRTQAEIAAGQRMFVWGHFMAPHQPYEPRPPHRGRFSSAEGAVGNKETLQALHRDPTLADAATVDNLRALYDEEILTANDYAMELLAGLDWQYRDAGRGGLLDNAVLIFLSDHGEELADRHGYFMHAKSLYSGVVQVPLVILGTEWQAGRRELRGIALAEVLPMILSGTAPSQEYFVASYRRSFFSIRDARWTLVHNPADDRQGPPEPPTDVAYAYPVVALFDRLVDPLELHDVAAANPEVTRRLLDALNDWYQGLQQPIGLEAAPLSAEDLAAIQALGYATTDDPESSSSTPWRGARWNP